MKDANVQWHPGFIGAMNLELKKNRDDLFFEKEYNLNTKPLEIDLLVIKRIQMYRLTMRLAGYSEGIIYLNTSLRGMNWILIRSIRQQLMPAFINLMERRWMQ